jgi:hypothetical protein
MRARGWRGGRAPNKELYRPALTHSSWGNIKAGWYIKPRLPFFLDTLFGLLRRCYVQRPTPIGGATQGPGDEV